MYLKIFYKIFSKEFILNNLLLKNIYYYIKGVLKIVMYLLELSLRYSPFPISIQKKEYEDVKRIYDDIKNSMNETTEASKLIELSCDKVQDKLIAVRAQEIISLQIYEKSSVAGGAKRPGFSLNID